MCNKKHPLHKALRPLVEALQGAMCNKRSINLTKLYGVSPKFFKVLYGTKSSPMFIELYNPASTTRSQEGISWKLFVERCDMQQNSIPEEFQRDPFATPENTMCNKTKYLSKS
jgi:hypothetical protein